MSTMMVPPTKAGRKTVTRRTSGLDRINEAPDTWVFERFETNVKGGMNAVFKPKEVFALDPDWKESFPCPYGQPGDILYVREEYYQLGHWEQVAGVKTKGGRMKWKFVPDSEDISFEEPATYRKGRHHKDPHTPAIHKRLAPFLHKRPLLGGKLTTILLNKFWWLSQGMRYELTRHNINFKDCSEGAKINYNGE